MPGMPVFQVSPGQLKGQMYVYDNVSGEIVALSVDDSGNLSVIGTVDLASGATVGLTTGTTVGLAAGTEEIGTVDLASGATVGLSTGTTVGLAAGTEEIGTVDLASGATVGLSTGTTVGLAAGTEEIGTVDLASGATVGLSTGTTVGLAAGTEVIGQVQSDLVFTYVDAFGAGTPLTTKTIDTATVNADAQNISKESSYNWYIRNTGTTSSDQDITVRVQISPDGASWVDDTGDEIPVAYNDTAVMITVNHFLQFARYVVTRGAADTDVVSCFQAQH